MTTDSGLGHGRYLKKEIEKALMREDELHSKIYKFKKQPKKAKRLGIKNKSYGKWIKKKNVRVEDIKEYIKLKRKNKKYY